MEQTEIAVPVDRQVRIERNLLSQNKEPKIFFICDSNEDIRNSLNCMSRAVSSEVPQRMRWSQMFVSWHASGRIKVDSKHRFVAFAVDELRCMPPCSSPLPSHFLVVALLP